MDIFGDLKVFDDSISLEDIMDIVVSSGAQYFKIEKPKSSFIDFRVLRLDKQEGISYLYMLSNKKVTDCDRYSYFITKEVGYDFYNNNMELMDRTRVSKFNNCILIKSGNNLQAAHCSKDKETLKRDLELYQAIVNVTMYTTVLTYK